MKDVDKFDNYSAYKPASSNYLEPQKAKTWALTSDSDMSDRESGREARLIALKSRVRQSASNLLLVLVKVCLTYCLFQTNFKKRYTICEKTKSFTHYMG